MSKILEMYKNIFVKRFDKNPLIPYYSYTDFSGLNCVEESFTNSIGIELKYFIYNYPEYNKDKLIVFCHGIGPGHSAYLREIEKLCKKGYQVLSLDYTGCDKSKGDNLISVNEPTRDVNDLLNHLKGSVINDQELIIIGHSLGAYTALNLVNINDNIHKAIIISGFFDVIKEMCGASHIPFKSLFKDIEKYEEEMNKEYSNIDNLNYLKNTSDNILFIHSMDDKSVPIKSSTLYIKKKIKNDNLNYLIVDKKNHNPNYTVEAVNYMNDTFNTLSKLKGDDEKKEYMKSRNIDDMTNQDDLVFEEMYKLIER